MAFLLMAFRLLEQTLTLVHIFIYTTTEIYISFIYYITYIEYDPAKNHQLNAFRFNLKNSFP